MFRQLLSKLSFNLNITCKCLLIETRGQLCQHTVNIMDQMFFLIIPAAHAGGGSSQPKRPDRLLFSTRRLDHFLLSVCLSVACTRRLSAQTSRSLLGEKRLTKSDVTTGRPRASLHGKDCQTRPVPKPVPFLCVGGGCVSTSRENVL